jgi:hypothetical protein
MNAIPPTVRPATGRPSHMRRGCDMTLGLAACAAVLLLLSGCQQALSSAQKPAAADTEKTKGGTADAKDEADTKGDQAGAKGESEAKDKEGAEGASEGVSLKPEEVEKLGLVTTQVQAITHEPEASGFGVVMTHDTIAQAVADLRTANAALRQSHAAYERSKRLVGTPGAMPADTQETAEKQAAVDRAGLELTRQRLSATYGQNPPWKWDEANPQLLALASGQAKLVRVTFPLGSLDDESPNRVRLARLNAALGGKGWESQQVWRAPADTNVPGRSFFTVLKDGHPSEGDHVLAWAPIGAPEPGVLVPASAVVISGGQYWVYVEEKPGTFVRTGIDPSHPTNDGYFVKEGVSPGDKIVTSAAGQLLARELNPSTGAED